MFGYVVLVCDERFGFVFVFFDVVVSDVGFVIDVWIYGFVGVSINCNEFEWWLVEKGWYG